MPKRVKDMTSEERQEQVDYDAYLAEKEVRQALARDLIGNLAIIPPSTISARWLWNDFYRINVMNGNFVASSYFTEIIRIKSDPALIRSNPPIHGLLR